MWGERMRVLSVLTHNLEKGGVAYILEHPYGYHLPKAIHPEIGRAVQTLSDEKGRELEPDEILEVF